MAAADTSGHDDEDLYDSFLESRGHEVGTREWEEEYNKKQCPECGGLHDTDATKCGSCGWVPVRNR